MKTNGHDWLKAVTANNPRAELPDNNPTSEPHRVLVRDNNLLGWRGEKKNNPADGNHPLWFEWVTVGMTCKNWLNKL